MSTATRSRSKTHPKRPAMTPEQATSFVTVSPSSILQVVEAIAARKTEGVHPDCTCDPYVDTLTFNRWKALGMHVKKGEKGLRICTFAETESSRERGKAAQEGEAYQARLRPVTTYLFCRCQVQANEEGK